MCYRAYVEAFTTFFYVAFQHLHYLGTLFQTEEKMLIQGRDITLLLFFPGNLT